ncbi:hypothetical protein H2199_001029 [Coniosporium tulheliwenetii]|uniref:Uncharacterized protein n=1 Tax=Coniosporium tulheliwenetii TaxID=3383036 RepID=A0ACC2ZNG7_9PEZI|nr:hypothetical protein H2199_001029 [Cladosporium sp. JES 115]
MNNDQFRRLVSDTPRRQDGATSSPKPGATPGGLLGSRARSSIPMTPRTVKGSSGIDFARQLADRNAASQPVKKFRSSAAPKGTKLASGYRDRTLERIEDDEDDKAKRVKALEESMKLGQIDRATFEALRDQITGGDVGATHLVKGLDWKLLERVRRGEDVLSGGNAAETKGKDEGPDVDEEFEKLEEREIAPMVKEKAEKKGEMAPPPPVAGVKRSRDAILAELKAQRKAAAEAKMAAQPQLGAKFKRVGEKTETSRIERDEKGREVLITVDTEGNVKRKVRKAKTEDPQVPTGLLMLDKDAKPLGMEVPELPPTPVQEEDDDIFEGVGTAYDPLAGLDEDDSASEAEDGEEEASPSPSESPTASPPADMPPPPIPHKPAAAPRNYFGSTTTSTTEETKYDVSKDPTILAALQKARKIDTSSFSTGSATTSHEETDEEREARLKRRAAMLASSDRDLEDMDLGFGSSRFGDAEDAEDGGKIKLSKWKGAGAEDGDDDGDGGERGGKKRKRGAKKRKGDKNSAADVMKVIERRKEGSRVDWGRAIQI